jgi:hypothetical protein
LMQTIRESHVGYCTVIGIVTGVPPPVDWIEMT